MIESEASKYDSALRKANDEACRRLRLLMWVTTISCVTCAIALGARLWLN